MPLTVTRDSEAIMGHKRLIFGKFDFDSAYPAGGEALSAASMGLRVIDGIIFGSGRLGYIYYTDTTMPATSVNVEILCPTGGTAPTTIAAPSEAISATPVMSGADSTTITTHTHAAGALTGGRGVELGAADASSLTAITFLAWGV